VENRKGKRTSYKKPNLRGKAADGGKEGRRRGGGHRIVNIEEIFKGSKFTEKEGRGGS